MAEVRDGAAVPRIHSVASLRRPGRDQGARAGQWGELCRGRAGEAPATLAVPCAGKAALGMDRGRPSISAAPAWLGPGTARCPQDAAGAGHRSEQRVCFARLVLDAELVSGGVRQSSASPSGEGIVPLCSAAASARGLGIVLGTTVSEKKI